MYPQLTRRAAREFLTKVLIVDAIDQDLVDRFLAEKAINEGSLALDWLASISSDLNAEIEKSNLNNKNLESLESQYSTRVHLALRDLPMEALGDVDFWTYCAAKYFWLFIVKRQMGSVLNARKQATEIVNDEESQSDANIPLERYLVGRDHYQIPLRLFLRAQAVNIDDDFLSDHPVTNGTDFWRSQILGVRTSAFPNWSRPIVAAQSKNELDIESVRPLGKRVNRLRANVSPVLHDEADAAAIVTPMWVEQ
jgi:hypothetical protein